MKKQNKAFFPPIQFPPPHLSDNDQIELIWSLSSRINQIYKTLPVQKIADS